MLNRLCVVDKMMDIVIPNNNEEEFIAMAEKLGYNALRFLYDINEYGKKFESKKIKVYTGILADSRNIIKNRHEKVFVAVKSFGDDREIIEQSKADLSCDNNFECSSNLCIDGECLSSSLWQKFISWLKKIFG